MGWRTLIRNRLAIFLALLIALTQVVSTAYTFAYETILQQAIPSPDLQTSTSGGIHAAINFGAAIFNFLLSPLLLRYLPVTLIMGMIAGIHICTGFSLIFYPCLYTASMAYLGFKMLDFSLFRTSKETLYIPLSFDLRYRSKELIDAFGYRFSKATTSLLMILAQKMGAGLTVFGSIVSILASSLWLVLAVLIPREKRT